LLDQPSSTIISRCDDSGQAAVSRIAFIAQR
jgi:hypothetical protein